MAAAALQRAATQGDRSEGAVRARLEVEVAVAGDNESRDGPIPPALIMKQRYGSSWTPSPPK
jgi:hypothetical protein